MKTKPSDILEATRQEVDEAMDAVKESLDQLTTALAALKMAKKTLDEAGFDLDGR